MSSPNLLCLLSGMISGLVFAPVFFVPGLFAISILCYHVKMASTLKKSCILGLLFGFGHFLTSIYWVSIGISVYIEEFWWFIPFALFGLPIILAFFIALACSSSWLFRNSSDYQMAFCINWVFYEWLRSWLFTGLPWNLIGYAASFSDIFIQPVNITGILGLSFVAIYIASSLYPIFTKQYGKLILQISTSLVILLMMTLYGYLRLERNPTNLTNIKVRLVQPSIPQTAKWDVEQLWSNLNSHIELSSAAGSPDLIVWSEAAMVTSYKHTAIKAKLLNLLNATNAILITGGITDNEKLGDEIQLYTSLYAIDKSGSLLFEYHKSHLVPFGEYIPFKSILPIKKITHGFLDYTEGDRKLAKLEQLNLSIKAQICYESIFFSEARISNKKSDVIVNVTNDAWYGRSSGPYQHLHIARMRSVENGLPMIRVANNGITAIIDPVGRIINKLELDEVNYIDGKIPSKLTTETIYSGFGSISIMIAIFLIIVVQYIIKVFLTATNILQIT
jgi:apolipoprotein N-acyltransferase